MAKKDTAAVVSIDGREVRITNPDKPYFSRDVKLSKLDVVQYYLAVASGAVVGISDRPSMLKRFVDGAEKPPFYQKRAPDNRPEWLRTVTLSFPSGRTAEEVVVDDAAGLAWIVNLGCIELHPHAVRTNDLDHPDELRIDLDPGPGVGWADVRRVAMEVKSLLEEMGLRGWPKTSGSRGMHVNVRIEQRWTFTEVRRAALALSRGSQLRSGGRRSGTEFFSTTTRMLRTAPRARRIRFGRCPTRAFRHRFFGRRFRMLTPRILRC
jgi:bifunctional non-homologous end joining protein LigD